MPTNDFDSQAMLAFFAQLGKEVDDLKTKISGLNESGGKGMGKVADETERFGKAIEKHRRESVSPMVTTIKELTTSLVGPVGLAYGVYKVAESLDKFAVGELRMRNFATNTGFSVDAVQKLQLQMRAAGLTAEEASQNIGSIGAKLQELRTHQQASGFYQAIAASNPALAEQVRLLVNQGKQQEALAKIQEAYIRGGERYKNYLVEITGVSRSAFDAQKVGLEGLIAPWKYSDAEAQKYHRTILGLETSFSNVWTSMANTMLKEINRMVGGQEGLEKSTKEMADSINQIIRDTFNPTPEANKRMLDKLDAERNALVSAPAQWSRSALEESNKSGVLHSLNRPFKAAHDFLFGGGDGDTAKDSNNLLRDMRDLMQKWDIDEHAGPGAGPGGGARGGMTFRPGIRTSGSGSELGVGTDTAAIPAGAGTPNAAIAEQRKPLMDEINASPALREKVYSMLQSEESGVGPRTATAEALFNRVAMIRKLDPTWTIAKELNSGFYGPINRAHQAGHELPITHGRSRAQSEAALGSTAGGSMVAVGRTDQGMAGDPNAAGPGRVKVPGTHGIFNFWKGDRDNHRFKFTHADSARFAEEEMRLAEQGRATIDKGMVPWNSNFGGAHIRVDFNGVPKGVKTDGDVLDTGVFKTLKINRSPQAPQPGGGTTDYYNRFSYE